jgi:hypothetical protein
MSFPVVDHHRFLGLPDAHRLAGGEGLPDTRRLAGGGTLIAANDGEFGCLGIPSCFSPFHFRLFPGL